MIRKQDNFLWSDILWIFAIVSFIFTLSITVIFPQKNINNLSGRHSWLSGSTIKFTNNWLKDGIVEDKFAMLERPYSIETQTIKSRTPYISYPNGTIVVTYIAAKITGQDQIDAKFVTILNIVFYALDALLIGFIMYLILRYLLKIKARKGKIFVSVLFASLWILFPNNVHYLKTAFFSDQLILFFSCLLLLLEILRNYADITTPRKKNIINTLLFFTILLGMSIEYYFWIQIFILCVINFTDSLLQKNNFIHSLKKVSIYIVPAVLALGLFLIQLIQLENWWERLINKASERLGQEETIWIKSYIGFIFYRTISVFGYIGRIFLLLSTIGGLSLLVYFKIAKKEKIQSSTEFNNFFKISLFIILPAYIQILVLKNHSAIHEFSLLKLNPLFVFGILLVSYVIFSFWKKSLNSSLEFAFKNKKIVLNRYIVLVTIFVVLFIFVNKYPKKTISYFQNIKNYVEERTENRSYEMETLISEINDYENVFFSFTERIPNNPPHSLTVSKKMMYKISTLKQIKSVFPNLDNNAVLMLVINKNNKEKSEEILKEEQYVIENFKMVREKNGYEIYSLATQNK